MFSREKRDKKPTWNNKQQNLDIISLKWGKEIATTYFKKSGRVAKLDRTIALWDFTWIEVSNIVKLTIYDRVLTAHKSKKTKKDMEMKPQLRDWIKIVKAAEKMKKISNRLIKDLSLQSVNMKLGKNEIVEPDNKDPTLSANLQTLTPKEQGPNLFACLFEIVLLNIRPLCLSIKIFVNEEV